MSNEYLPEFIANHTQKSDWRGAGYTCITPNPNYMVEIRLSRFVGSLGFGLSRFESLASQGKDVDAVDSVNFAKDLLSAIGPCLSTMDMENIVKVFQDELNSEDKEIKEESGSSHKSMLKRLLSKFRTSK